MNCWQWVYWWPYAIIDRTKLRYKTLLQVLEVLFSNQNRRFISSEIATDFSYQDESFDWWDKTSILIGEQYQQ